MGDETTTPAAGDPSRFGTLPSWVVTEPPEAQVPPAAPFGAPAAPYVGPGLPPPPVPAATYPGGEYAAGPYQAAGYPQLLPYAPPPKRGLPGWAIALIAVAGVFVLLVAAAVVIPVFQAQRDKAVLAATQVNMPATMTGLSRSADPSLQQSLDSALADMPACHCFGTPVGAVYGNSADHHVIVVMASHFNEAPSSAQRSDLADGVWEGARRQAASSGAVMGETVEKDPGRLGGKLSCAPITANGVRGQACLSVDAGAMVYFVEYDLAGVNSEMGRTVREAVETRT